MQFVTVHHWYRNSHPSPSCKRSQTVSTSLFFSSDGDFANTHQQVSHKPVLLCWNVPAKDQVCARVQAIHLFTSIDKISSQCGLEIRQHIHIGTAAMVRSDAPHNALAFAGHVLLDTNFFVMALNCGAWFRKYQNKCNTMNMHILWHGYDNFYNCKCFIIFIHETEPVCFVSRTEQ